MDALNFYSPAAAEVLHNEQNPHRALATRIRRGLELGGRLRGGLSFEDRMSQDTVRSLGDGVQARLAQCDRLAPVFDAQAHARAVAS